MKKLCKSSQFKKDFKRFSKDLAKVEKLFAIVNKLLNDEDIPEENDPHPLKGEWKNGPLEKVCGYRNTIKTQCSPFIKLKNG